MWLKRKLPVLSQDSKVLFFVFLTKQKIWHNRLEITAIFMHIFRGLKTIGQLIDKQFYGHVTSLLLFRSDILYEVESKRLLYIYL